MNLSLPGKRVRVQDVDMCVAGEILRPGTKSNRQQPHLPEAQCLHTCMRCSFSLFRFLRRASSNVYTPANKTDGMVENE